MKRKTILDYTLFVLLGLLLSLSGLGISNIYFWLILFTVMAIKINYSID